jgi:isopentenyl diphosphate isomerase/L-lactate dehydrogenase-like FMN-dependent dehydrogenase
VISDWINVADAEREGLEKLEQGPRDYFAGGAGDEVTLRENVAAWGNWRLRPRVLNDVREVSTGAEVLGGPVSLPVMVAPVAYQRMAHPEAEQGMAAGAAEAGTAMCLSTLSTTRPAEVAAAAPEGRHFFQLYAFKDAGVVVSNHGGRQLDRSVATAEALPEIVEAIDGRATVLVDGGIRRGIDVATALALGADAVLVGRPALWGLAAGGREGVARVLGILREELELTLGLCGCTSPGDLGRAHVRRAPLASVYSV